MFSVVYKIKLPRWFFSQTSERGRVEIGFEEGTFAHIKGYTGSAWVRARLHSFSVLLLALG